MIDQELTLAQKSPRRMGRNLHTPAKSLQVARGLAGLGLFACLPLICIPKGGVKASGLPLTISYLFMGIACLAAIFVYRRFRLPASYLYCYLATIPLALLALLKVTLLPPNATFGAALIITVVIIPSIFLIVIRKPVELSFALSGKTIRICVLLVNLFGIADFLSRNFVHIALDVPYITKNADDDDDISGKSNNRGRFIKLSSSYGNGNIYGICMLILGPICFALGAGRIARSILILSMFLTLSRTVWVGLVLWAILWFVLYRRTKPSTLVVVPLAVLAAVGIGAGTALLLGFDQSFLLDSSMGGRSEQADLTWTWMAFTEPFTGFGEMTYFSIFAYFGFVGLLAFCVWLWSPIAAVIANWDKVKRCPLAKAATISMVLYAVVAFIDGAFLLIPVMPLFWMAASLALSDPSCLVSQPTRRIRPSARTRLKPASLSLVSMIFLCLIPSVATRPLSAYQSQADSQDLQLLSHRSAGQATVNLGNFGARCDGNSAINSALSKAIASGAKALQLPAGTCIVENFEIPSNTSIIGAPNNTSVVKSKISPHIFVLSGTPRGHIQNVTIENLTFVSKSNRFNPDELAILAVYADSLLIKGNVAKDISLLNLGGKTEYSDYQEQFLNHRIVFNDNTCQSTQNLKGACGVFHWVDGVLVSGNTVKGYQHGFWYWGGDGGTVIALSQPRWAKNLEFINNTVSGCGGGGIWGSKGENVTFSKNRISDVGDVGLDFEGTVSGLATDNTCSDAHNGCGSVFFVNKGIKFNHNTFSESVASQPVVRIYNSKQLADNQDIEFNQNVFECKDPVKTCTVDDAKGPASDLQFRGNRFIGTRLEIIANNAQGMYIVGNWFSFTRAIEGSPITIRTFGHEAFVLDNVIKSAVPASDSAAAAITASNSDYNHDSYYFIGSNKIAGFKTAVKMDARGKNPGTIARFTVCSNETGGADIKKPTEVPQGQKVEITEGNSTDCSAPALKYGPLASLPKS